MKIERSNTEDLILQEIGKRFEHRRIELGITQEVAAKQAGISKRTIERIEKGKDCQFSTLIRLLRVIDLVEQLEQLVPESTPSPMMMLKLKGKIRQRASSRAVPKVKKTWQWGDEQ